jgi:hypothetical protein
LNRACKQQIETRTATLTRQYTSRRSAKPLKLQRIKRFVAMPPQGERKFALMIDNSDDDSHDQQGARQSMAAAPPMDEAPTKGNNRARIVHRQIRRGSVYELTELLKDKIHLGPRPTPTKKKIRSVDDLEGDDVSHNEWVVLETGKVRELAEFLKDKIPMCFPGDARPGSKTDNMPTKLSFEDMLANKIPNLRSSRTKNEGPRLRRAHSEMPTTSVLDMALLLQDKIHMRSPLDKRFRDYLAEEDDNGSTSCCKENCRCCRQLAKLLSCLEAVVGNRLLVQLNDEEEHEDASQSSTLDEHDHTLFIPKSKGRAARKCRLSPDTSAGDEATSFATLARNDGTLVATMTPTPLSNATRDDTARVTLPMEQSPRDDPVPATVQKMPIPSASPSTERSSSSSCESESGTSWSVIDDTESTMSTSESHSDHDFSEVTGSERSSMSNNETKPRNRILPSWKCSNAEYERRLKTEYVLSSKKLCSQRDSALLGLDSVPWDRSRYGTWRQQHRQVERKNERLWA